VRRNSSFVKAVVLAAAMSTLWLADLAPGAPLGLGLGREAHAVVGAPLTPGSVAGVARRTTRRVVVANNAAHAAATPAPQPSVGTVVSTLPAGCVQENQGGVAYQRCGSVRYRPAFQGNNLVYVVQ
jgi:hypothetical protein